LRSEGPKNLYKKGEKVSKAKNCGSWFFHNSRKVPRIFTDLYDPSILRKKGRFIFKKKTPFGPQKKTPNLLREKGPFHPGNII